MTVREFVSGLASVARDVLRPTPRSDLYGVQVEERDVCRPGHRPPLLAASRRLRTNRAALKVTSLMVDGSDWPPRHRVV